MKTSKVEYLGGLRTRATHIRSSQEIITDAPIDNHGKGEAFSPTDLTSTSLASCMLTTMGIAAQAHGIDIDGTTADVLKVMLDKPRRIGRVEIDIYLPPNNYSDKEKTILEKAALTCPVAISLHPDLEDIVKFHW